MADSGRLELVGERLDAGVQRVLVELPWARPRRRVGVRARDHLVAADLGHPQVAGDEVLGALEHRVAAPGIVVARHRVDGDPLRGHALIGELDPASQLVEQDPLEQLGPGGGVGTVPRDLVRARDPRVHAVVAHAPRSAP